MERIAPVFELHLVEAKQEVLKMRNKLPSQLNLLLEDVVRKQRPDLVRLLDKVRDGDVTDEERCTLMDLISTEFCTSGLGPGDEPNERGFLLEELLSYVNPVGKEQRDGNSS